MAELAADTAIRIIRGTPASEMSVRTGQTSPMFDWRQLRRWNIQLDQLPPNSDVRFREYTFWEQNRRYIAGALAVFLMQSCLIAGLLMQRSRRRRAEGALRANEQALHVSQDDTRKLAGRIIAAQEVERGRIARELHDDISQKVALLAMDIHQIGLSDAPGRARTSERHVRTDSRDRHGPSQSLARASSREAPDSRARAGHTVSVPGSRRAPSSRHRFRPRAHALDRAARDSALPLPDCSGGAAKRRQAQRRTNRELSGSPVRPTRFSSRCRIRAKASRSPSLAMGWAC